MMRVAPGLGLRLADGFGHGVAVVAVHLLDVPAVGLEPLARVLVRRGRSRPRW